MYSTYWSEYKLFELNMFPQFIYKNNIKTLVFLNRIFVTFIKIKLSLAHFLENRRIYSETWDESCLSCLLIVELKPTVGRRHFGLAWAILVTGFQIQFYYSMHTAGSTLGLPAMSKKEKKKFSHNVASELSLQSIWQKIPLSYLQSQWSYHKHSCFFPHGFNKT